MGRRVRRAFGLRAAVERRLRRHDQLGQHLDVHDHEQRPGAAADGHQARRQRQRRHGCSVGVPDGRHRRPTSPTRTSPAARRRHDRDAERRLLLGRRVRRARGLRQDRVGRLRRHARARAEQTCTITNNDIASHLTVDQARRQRRRRHRRGVGVHDGRDRQQRLRRALRRQPRRRARPSRSNAGSYSVDEGGPGGLHQDRIGRLRRHDRDRADARPARSPTTTSPPQLTVDQARRQRRRRHQRRRARSR